MSKATKRKHVVKEVLTDFILPAENQEIVRIAKSCGNNLHEVDTANGDNFLVSMPTKYRKNIWIKRGDYVLVERIEEGDKVKAEIVHILYKDQIQHIKEEKLWPKAFEDKPSERHTKENAEASNNTDCESDRSSDCEMDNIFVNTNRVVVHISSDESSSESEYSDVDN